MLPVKSLSFSGMPSCTACKPASMSYSSSPKTRLAMMNQVWKSSLAAM